MRFFTIGSCFAREIRKVLKEKFDVYPNDNYDELIYYNTYSILYEFERPERLFYQNSDGQWQCPFRRLVMAHDLPTVTKLSEKIDKYMDKCISRSDVFIITLGITEVHEWNGFMMSSHPQYGLEPGTRSGAKSTFYNSTIEDNYNNLKKIRTLIRAKNSQARIIFTVSPVPLQRTFTSMGLSAANHISKRKLRTAIKELTGVEYFDSYEYAMSKDCFKADGRHVKPEIINQIVERFYENIIH